MCLDRSRGRLFVVAAAAGPLHSRAPGKGVAVLVSLRQLLLELFESPYVVSYYSDLSGTSMMSPLRSQRSLAGGLLPDQMD
jgi:hypothetical protein